MFLLTVHFPLQVSKSAMAGHSWEPRYAQRFWEAERAESLQKLLRKWPAGKPPLLQIHSQVNVDHPEGE